MPFLILAIRGGSNFSFSDNIHTYLGWWFGGIVLIGGNEDFLYKKISLQIIRFLVGILAFVLPVSVILYTGIKLGSISAYYHSKAGWLFTWELILLGTLLIIYKGFHANYQDKHVDNLKGNSEDDSAKVYDSILTNFAGIGAFGLAAFPTKIDPEQLDATYHEPLRSYYNWLTTFISPDTIRMIHLIFTGILMVLMIVLFLTEFTLTSKKLKAKTSRFGRIAAKIKNIANKALYSRKTIIEHYRLGFYILCTITIVAGFIAMIPMLNVDRPTYWLEFLGLVGLGGAWLFKGTTSLFDSAKIHAFVMTLLLIYGFLIGALIIV